MNEGCTLFIGRQPIEEFEQGDAIRLLAGSLFCFTAAITDFFPFNHNGAIVLLGKRQHIIERKACATAHFKGDSDPAPFSENTV